MNLNRAVPVSAQHFYYTEKPCGCKEKNTLFVFKNRKKGRKAVDRHRLVKRAGRCYTVSEETCLQEGEHFMKRGFLFAAGSFYGLRARPEAGDIVIAADAGAELCAALHITPLLTLGDFDSLKEPLPPGARVERLPVEKDDTDTFAGVRRLLAMECTEIHIYGGTGGKRLDHTLANLQTLLFIRRHGARGYLYDRNFVWTAIENESITVAREVDWGLLSVFALSGTARGIRETGLQYDFAGGDLNTAYPMGVSNHFAAPEATVSVEKGALLVGWELRSLRT